MVAYATRDDIDEILTSIKQFKIMINEDLLGMSSRIDRVGKRLDHVDRKANKRFDQVDARLGRIETQLIDTEGMLRVHISNPSAHRRAS